MLNLELARIVTAERHRESTNSLRQAAFRADLDERKAARKTIEAGSPRQGSTPGQGPRPALGPSR
jgi:hypothetical protein